MFRKMYRRNKMYFKTLTELKRWADRKLPAYLPFDLEEVDTEAYTLPRDIVEMQKDGLFHYFRQENGFEFLMSSKNSLIGGEIE